MEIIFILQVTANTLIQFPKCASSNNIKNNHSFGFYCVRSAGICELFEFFINGTIYFMNHFNFSFFPFFLRFLLWQNKNEDKKI